MSLGSLLLKTSLSPHSGYGADGVGLTLALSKLGFDVHLRPMHVATPLPPEVAAHFCKVPDPPFDFLVHHTDPDQIGLIGQENRVAPVRVCWTMWEYLGTSGMRDEATLSDRLSGYTKLLCYDDVSTQALSKHVTNGMPVEKLQGGYWSDDWAQNPTARDWTGTFRFGMVGQLGPRKNPFAAIQAFAELKSEHGDSFDAELHLKTIIAGLDPSLEKIAPGIKIHSAVWPVEQLKAFYMSLHMLLAPSWGEGKNLPALEAMSSGCPVAATDFGGMHEWMSSDWAYPLQYSLEAHEGDMQSARVDVEEMKQVMWEAYSNRALPRGKGERAANIIPSMLDWSQVAERLRLKLLN